MAQEAEKKIANTQEKIEKKTTNAIKPNIVLSIQVEENLYQLLLPAKASLAESYAVVNAFKDMVKVMIDDAVKKTEADAKEAKAVKEKADLEIKEEDKK